jgi:AraC-like DNA-binding protein
MKSVLNPPVALTFEDWSVLHTRLLWCYEGQVEAAHRRYFSQRNQLSAWWLIEGSVKVRRGGKTWVARAGEWIFCGPQPLHQEFSADARILSVNFKLEWPSGDSLVDQILVLPARAHPALGRTARTLVRVISRRFREIGTALPPQPVELADFFETQQFFTAWVHAYVKAVIAVGVMPARMGRLDPRVLAALGQLDRHDWRVPFQEKSLVEGTGLSAGHLDRLFVQQVGLTTRAYLQKRRLESATSALANSSVPAKKIAYDLGFSSASHFSHWLRHATGKSPREVRAGAR